MIHGYTFQHIYTISELSPEVIQYYMNIISLVCANARVQKIYNIRMVQKGAHIQVYKESTSMNRKRALTSLLRGNSGGTQGVWKDEALDGRLEIHATAAPL